LYSLGDSLDKINGIGSTYRELLSKLAIFTIGDLLYHFPHRYVDSSSVETIANLSKSEVKTCIASVSSIKNINLKNRKSLQKGIIYDDDNEIEVTWFNQPFLIKSLKTNCAYIFRGKLNPKSIKPQLTSPQFEKFIQESQSIHLGRIVPMYTLTEKISVNWLRSIMHKLVAEIDNIIDLQDNLPIEIINKYNLLDLKSALTLIHFPNSNIDIINSRKRLGFDELLVIQHKLLLDRINRKSLATPKVIIDDKIINKFINKLNFKLTESQISAYKQIFSDYCKNSPMRRLIQGDVGSGKTIIAAIASIPIININNKVILLAPTSILAQQHYESFNQLFDKFTIKLITSKSKHNINDILEADILIGTHALLYLDSKIFKNVGLLIIDEQHKFGVKQRQLIQKLSDKPIHILHLTATPIPRTLALTLFGDLDVSIIQKPLLRKPVITKIIPEEKRNDAINWLKNQIPVNQIYWVHPLIEESDKVSGTSLEVNYKYLTKFFESDSIGILHGKLSEKDKNIIIENFKSAQFNILLSTTVIEVGVDIPNANIIIIEDAEKFGLAQLHQLRGRVGRRDKEGWCFLFSKNQAANKRLQYFAQESNGIKIAEYDLQSRGPGEVYGTIQSGLPELKIANFTNTELLLISKEAAEYLINHNYQI
jgi:ATP-dependent DNA helicase RecG